MSNETLYIISYDIADPKRWRRIFRLMEGYGEWLQLSVFQARLSQRRHAELRVAIEGIIRQGEDHVLILELGPADAIRPAVESLGKTFDKVERKPVIV